jgi:signal transduction histidine kinase
MVGGIAIRGIGRDADYVKSGIMKKGRAAQVTTTALTALAVRYASAQTDELSEDREIMARYEQYRADPWFLRTVVDAMRPEIERALAQLHDYRQFVAAIIQNVNVWWETDGPGGDIAAAKNPHAIVAIYHAARIMESRLVAHRFLNDPKSVRTKLGTVQVHKMFAKFGHIYEQAAQDKNVAIETTGMCFGRVHANYDAVGLIPQALLDNAIKYSPRSARIMVEFEEDHREITVKMSSYGPLLDPDEHGLIFEPFRRGRHASNFPEGMGLGLGMVGLVTETMGWRRAVAQDPHNFYKGCYWTTFSVTFDREQG